jgi:hypothetical protein
MYLVCLDTLYTPKSMRRPGFGKKILSWQMTGSVSSIKRKSKGSSPRKDESLVEIYNVNEIMEGRYNMCIVLMIVV